MSTSVIDARIPVAVDVVVDDQALTVELDDGRRIAVPIGWYPRLAHGSQAERANYRLIGGGTGVHWPDLEEDLNVEGLLQGRRSVESSASLGRWLANRPVK